MSYIQTYSHMYWFSYSFLQQNGERVTVRELFPPGGREDIYGGLTGTEVRTAGQARFNELKRKYGKVTAELYSKE